MVLSEVTPSSPPPLTAVRWLAQHHRHPDSRPSLLEEARAAATDPSTAPDATVLLMAATLLVLEDCRPEAMRLCHAVPDLELLALSVQTALSMHRPDAALADVAAMSALDDDATLTQLASAWTGLALGGRHVQEAWHALHDLGDRHGWTVRMHVTLAAAAMRMGRWEDAEGELLQAFEKNPKDADALANLAVVCVHLGKPNSRYVALLRDAAPSHPFVVRADAHAAAFDKAAGVAA